MSDVGDVLWEPSKKLLEECSMNAFKIRAEAKSGKFFENYEKLHEWSVECGDDFWRLLFTELDFRSEGEMMNVTSNEDEENKPLLVRKRWFDGVKLCVAENLMKERSDNPAIVSYVEGRDVPRTISYRQLFLQVARLAKHCRENFHLQAGDVVAALMPNTLETVELFLAVNSIGCVWTSCSPDFGISAVLDRFRQVEPKLLIMTDGYCYKNRKHGIMSKNQEILKSMPSVQNVVLVSTIKESVTELDKTFEEKMTLFGSMISDHGSETKDDDKEMPRMDFSRVTSDHPLYVMYSSGTTGKPKSIVQGWGVLVNQLKEHKLHLNVQKESTMLFYTTCGWMMWNWALGSLGCGAKLVLYDGAPITKEDPAILIRIAAAERVTHFGTSAGYLTALEQMEANVREIFHSGAKRQNQQSITTVMVTGSVSSASNFRYIRECLGTNVQYVSMSGGTDINSCFALGCPLKPVILEQLQCLALGADVAVFSQEGKSMFEETGELVCRNAIPAMPLRFWNDPSHKAFFNAYFSRFPGVWCHGDYAEITKQRGLIIRGRSDTTMNPGGVRMGSSDFYSILDTFDDIKDTVVIGQQWKKDERILLLVVLKDGARDLDEQLQSRIRAELRSRLSPRHIPARIVSVPDIPYTFSGKKAELAVKLVAEGRDVPNLGALRNPQSIAALKAMESMWQG